MYANSIIFQDYHLEATGDVRLESTQEDGLLQLTAVNGKGRVSVHAGDEVRLFTSKADIIASDSAGAVFISGNTKVKLAGGSGVTATMELAMDGVTIQLTPLVSIKLSPTGIELTAGASKLTVGVAGITLQAPTITEKAEAARQVDQGLSQDTAKGPRQITSPLATLS